MDIKLSVIMPVYNGENYIENAITSIITQNRRDVELIVIDDGSVDKTYDICKKYISQNVIILKSTNKGAGAARNEGIAHAKGQWISFLDCDDLYLYGVINNNFIQSLNDYLEKGIEVIYTPRIRANMFLTEIKDITYPEKIEEIQNHMPKLQFWTCMYKRDFLIQKSVKFYEYQKQDIETAYRFQVFSKCDKAVVDNTMCFYLQRINMESNTHTWNYYNLYEIGAKVYYDLFIKSVDKDDKNFCINISTNRLLYFFALCIKKGSNDDEIMESMRALASALNRISNESEITIYNKVKCLFTAFLYKRCKFLIRKGINKKGSCTNNLIQQNYATNAEILNRLISISAKVTEMEKRKNIEGKNIK